MLVGSEGNQTGGSDSWSSCDLIDVTAIQYSGRSKKTTYAPMKTKRTRPPSRKRPPRTTRVVPRVSRRLRGSTATSAIYVPSSGFSSLRTSQNEMNVSMIRNIHEPAVPWPRWKSSNPCWYR